MFTAGDAEDRRGWTRGSIPMDFGINALHRLQGLDDDGGCWEAMSGQSRCAAPAPSGFRHPCLPDAWLLRHRDFGIHASTAMTIFYHNGHEGTQGRIKDVGKRSADSPDARVLSRRPNSVRESGQSGFACSPIT